MALGGLGLVIARRLTAPAIGRRYDLTIRGVDDSGERFIVAGHAGRIAGVDADASVLMHFDELETVARLGISLPRRREGALQANAVRSRRLTGGFGYAGVAISETGTTMAWVTGSPLARFQLRR